MAGRPVHNVVVFLGPSLPRSNAERILPATYLPPAKRGDIYRLQAAGVKTIILIDGYFHSTPSVWPREILHAINDGIRVFGASSMGALRAAELCEHGMIGVGTVFEWYRDGIIDGDDEVALLHGPEEIDYCAMSEPLVNIRRTLRQAVDDGCLSPRLAKVLIGYVKAIYYPERSYQKLMLCPVLDRLPSAERAAIEQYLVAKRIDIKRADAEAVLHCCAARTEALPAALPIEPCRDRAQLWELERLHATGFAVGEETALGRTIIEEAARHEQLVSELWERLGIRAFILDWGLQNGASLLDVEETMNSMQDPPTSWLRANGLSQRRNRELVAKCTLADQLVSERLQDKKGMEVDRRYVERRILGEWARQHGVSRPRSMDEGDSSYQPSLSTECAPSEPPAGGDDRALAAWMVRQGPCYFGLPWSFEAELIQELQRTGGAAELLAVRQSR